MEEVDIRAPLYYVIGRDISPEDMNAAHYVFTITPCSTGVVSRHMDKALIEPLTFDIFKAEDEQACRELAAHLARATGCPMLTVGEGKGMTAVHFDGVEEEICLSSLTATS